MQIYGPVIKPGKFSSKKMSYKVSNGGNLSKRDSISLKSPQIKTRTKSFSTIRKPILNEIERPSHQNNNQSISTQYTSAFTSGILKPSKSPKIPEFDIYVNEKLQKDFGNTGYKVKKKSLSQRFMIKNGGGSRRVDKRKKSKKKGKSNKGIIKRAVSVRSNKTILKNFNLMDVVKNSKADKECKEI